jgi:hypothetical protein
MMALRGIRATPDVADRTRAAHGMIRYHHYVNFTTALRLLLYR